MFTPEADDLLRLIETINRKSHSAQLGLAALSFVGLLLLAFAFSTTDLDLLRNTAEPLGALNVPIPVIAGFALAPLVFVAIHAFTLIRYDMLGQDLDFYRKRIDEIEPDNAPLRNWHRHLFVNVEFVQILLLRNSVTNDRDGLPGKGHRPREWLIHSVVWLSMVFLPLLTLAIIEISALRLQSWTITFTQLGAIAIDVFLLFWALFRALNRQGLPDEHDAHDSSRTRVPPLRRLLGDSKLVWRAARRAAYILILPMLIVVYGMMPPGVPIDQVEIPSDNTVLLGRTWRNDPTKVPNLSWWSRLVRQPLDLVLCPETHWGCRYLTIASRGFGQTASSSLDFSYRSLRYADFHNFRTAAHVNFSASNLSNATFANAHLSGADFSRATLTRADFRRAQLPYADLSNTDLTYAHMENASLLKANMRGANLSYASMFNADLIGTDLKRATLISTMAFYTHFVGADISHADATFAFFAGSDFAGAQLYDSSLSGAYLQGTRLWGADLRDARLIAADLRDASLFAADLSGASLEGALLDNTHLRFTDLGGARLFGARTNVETVLSYADVGGIDMITPLDDKTVTAIRISFKKVRTNSNFKSLLLSRLRNAERPPFHHRCVAFSAIPHSLLVDSWPETRFPSLQNKWVMAASECLMAEQGGALESSGCSGDPGKTHPKRNGQRFSAATSTAYDHAIESQLTSAKPVVSGAVAHSDEFWFSLAQRALREGSDDDQARNAAVATALRARIPKHYERKQREPNPFGNASVGADKSHVSIVRTWLQERWPELTSLKPPPKQNCGEQNPSVAPQSGGILDVERSGLQVGSTVPATGH